MFPSARDDGSLYEGNIRRHRVYVHQVAVPVAREYLQEPLHRVVLLYALLLHLQVLSLSFLSNRYSVIYHTFMAPNMSGPVFETMVRHLDELVPIMFTTVTFAMGFYVTQIYNRYPLSALLIFHPPQMVGRLHDAPVARHLLV